MCHGYPADSGPSPERPRHIHRNPGGKMKRRDFIKSALATGGVLATNSRLLRGDEAKAPPVDPSIKRVLVMFKCHFDAGFIDTQANVVSWYFDKYFPKAIETAAALRQA